MSQTVRKAKQKSEPKQPARKESGVQRKRPNWALLAVIVVFTALTTFLLFEYVFLSRLPEKLLGKWVVVSASETKYIDQTIEFSRDGSVTTKLPGGREAAGRAMMHDDKLYVALSDPNNLARETVTIYVPIALEESYVELERAFPLKQGDPEPFSGAAIRLERPAEKNR